MMEISFVGFSSEKYTRLIWWNIRRKIDTSSYTLQMNTQNGNSSSGRSFEAFWFAFILILQRKFFFLYISRKKIPFFCWWDKNLLSRRAFCLFLGCVASSTLHHLFWTKISTMIYFLYVQHTTKRSVQ